MPAIPITYTEETGFFTEENGHRVLKLRGVTLELQVTLR